ncbi:unnamed protein product [Rhizophagus irregularis]|nr:unnamed protein product [Rhizophagus irregularis]
MVSDIGGQVLWRCFIVIFHMHLETNILITFNLVQIMHSVHFDMHSVELNRNKSILYDSNGILTLELDDEHKFYIHLPYL